MEGCPWHAWASFFGAPNIKWCEQTLCSWISEPANAWSNLGYLFVALILLRIARLHLSETGSASASIRSLAGAVLFMGVMSFFYHASNIFLTQWLDFIGMFLMFGVVIGRNCQQLNLFSGRVRRLIVTSLVIFCCGMIPFLYAARFQYQVLVVILAGLAFGLEFLAARITGFKRSSWLWSSVVFFLAAFVASLVDHSNTYCEPANHFFHGHVLWHLLSACGFWALGMFWSKSAHARV
jgi:hypothetical protein